MSEMQLVDYKNNSSEKMNCKRSLEKSIDSNKSTQIMAIKDEKLKVKIFKNKFYLNDKNNVIENEM